ncbi:uncharacterized protein TNCV_3957721 [Trichonephila clavipes]|nr:uncharacterized protein TNCV_3957721 [Trichonephila clavipes]
MELLSHYDFKAELNPEECIQRLPLAFGAMSRGFKEFCSQEEEHAGRPAVIPDNVSVIRKMLFEDNRCTYQRKQKEFNFGSTAKIIHEEL